MPRLATQLERSSVVIAIGGAAVRIHTTDVDFLQMLEDRYAGFLSAEAGSDFDFDVHLGPPFNAEQRPVLPAQADATYSTTLAAE